MQELESGLEVESLESLALSSEHGVIFRHNVPKPQLLSDSERDLLCRKTNSETDSGIVQYTNHSAYYMKR